MVVIGVHNMSEHDRTKESKRTYKDVGGKPRFSLLNLSFIEMLILVREYGVRKYGRDVNDTRTWERVSVEQLQDAMMRHVIDQFTNPKHIDESGLPALVHIAANSMLIMNKVYTTQQLAALLHTAREAILRDGVIETKPIEVVKPSRRIKTFIKFALLFVVLAVYAVVCGMYWAHI